MGHLVDEKGFIDKTTHSFLLNREEHIKVPHIYIIPKIHKIGDKPLDVDPAFNVSWEAIKVPLRPIISQCGGPTEKNGQYLDRFQIPIVKHNEHI